MVTMLFIIGIVWLILMIVVLTFWHDFISDQEDHSITKDEDGN